MPLTRERADCHLAVVAFPFNDLAFWQVSAYLVLTGP